MIVNDHITEYNLDDYNCKYHILSLRVLLFPS